MDVHDPWIDRLNLLKDYNIDLVDELNENYDAIILAVSHTEFLNIDLKKHLSLKGVLFDVKGVLNKIMSDGRL